MEEEGGGGERAAGGGCVQASVAGRECRFLGPSYFSTPFTVQQDFEGGGSGAHLGFMCLCGSATESHLDDPAGYDDWDFEGDGVSTNPEDRDYMSAEWW